MDNLRPPLPEGFVVEAEAMLGVEAPAFLASLEEGSARALRLNPLRANAEAMAAEFTDGSVPWEPLGRYLRAGSRPGASIAHAAGAYYLQEASAMVSVAALDPRPGECVLDLCAAPGGKSTQIAARLTGEGMLVCNEPVPERAKILASNLERMGVRNACVICARPDALATRWPGRFDAVLCDAPCSGEGMFRRDPATRTQWTPSSPAGCARRQAAILDSAAALLRPGGRLVYSTCTFNRSENEYTIDAFLQRHPDFVTSDFELPGLGASRYGMLRVWPHRQRGDGHFAAKLCKHAAISDSRRCGRITRAHPGDSSHTPLPPSEEGERRGSASEEGERSVLLAQLEAEIGALPRLPGWKLERRGNCVCAFPVLRPDLSGLRVLSPGLRLMRVGPNHVVPEHALAMALDATTFARRLDLDDALARRALAGEVLPCPDALHGWTLLCWNNLPLGWGKASQGCMKNHLPKVPHQSASLTASPEGKPFGGA